MKVLQLCSKPPRPAIDGGCIAMDSFTQNFLQLGYDLKILTVATDKHPFLPKELSKKYIEETQIESIFIDTRVNVVDAFASLITQDNYNVSRFFSVDLDIKLKNILRKRHYDIVQLESLFMTPYLPSIRRFSKAKVVLRSHNLEFNIWKRLAKQEISRPKKIYLNFLAKKLKEYEIDLMNQVDGIISISPVDREKYLHMGCKVPITSIPTALDLNNYIPRATQRPEPKIFHIGAMDWAPNQEGVLWFLNEVWPAVIEKHPKAKLVLAGKGLDFYQSIFGNRHPNVDFAGEVGNAIEFMQNHDIMIVPLLSGGGIRIKILEGMALEKLVISSKIGAEGIEAKHGKHFLISDNATEFAKNLIMALNEPELRRTMGEQARKFIHDHYSFEELNLKIDGFYNKLLGR